MTTLTTAPPTSAADVLSSADALAPELARRASEIEAARSVPEDLLARLVEAGCFRMLLPVDLGGIGADVASVGRVLERLARADASVAWTAMIGAGAFVDLAGLPAAELDALYGNGPDVLVAGVFSPSGVAVPVDDGYRVSGRWAFASGSPHAEWFYGNCVEQTDDGTFRLRIALFPRGDVTIEDTWHVVGLCGTGSHHFTVDNVVVPATRTSALLECEPTIDAAVTRIPPPSLFALGIASVAIGVAQGALDDVEEIAGTKQPLLAPTTLAGNATFHRDLATSDTELRAVRALLGETADAAWERASAGLSFPSEQTARTRAAAAAAVTSAARVVTTAYRAGGGSAIYLDSPLQRRLRDVHAITQHFLVRPDVMTNAGAVLHGLEPDTPVF